MHHCVRGGSTKRSFISVPCLCEHVCVQVTYRDQEWVVTIKRQLMKKWFFLLLT